jgi:hypothetical protein
VSELVEPEMLTPNENAFIRREMRETIVEAMAEAKKRGYRIDPKIEKAKLK